MILVTGGGGFIGSLLVAELNDLGITDILLVDHKNQKGQDQAIKDKNLAGLKFSKYLEAEELFTDPEFKKISAIYHMGACSSTTERDLEYLKENNIEYSKILFKQAKELNIPMIYASSAATYGSGEQGYSDEHQKIAQYSALNPYGDSKLKFDLWVLEQLALGDTPEHFYGIKFFNVYGPNEYHKGEMRSLVHKAFGQIKSSGQVKLFKSHKKGFKDGEQLRDFVYGPDVARGMIELMKVPGKEIINMGTGKARSFYDLADQTFKSMHLETKIVFIPMPESIREQYQYFTEAEMTKFSKILPNFEWRSLEEGVHDYVVNYLVKNDPYRGS
ncbi:MAG: ADP-glyceromanno-heptose 6-epimerase [Halobacteriovoraceae bacterium]|jgi:ADP-L-glycero-D-manno-heptose 6-epimerase|nr:ADP-glyceromanno-heptose 6-epimerase [Halobacteriovoraceae bacterium]MBT5095580.1 ADP-glyceromanno-heptose 6-epimerase [Halobacteriovoraceae bacterium]